jgi:hypothetical protein
VAVPQLDEKELKDLIAIDSFCSFVRSTPSGDRGPMIDAAFILETAGFECPHLLFSRRLRTWCRIEFVFGDPLVH